MEGARYFARCGVCGVEFEYDGLDTPQCCGAMMIVRFDDATSADNTLPGPRDREHDIEEDKPVLDPSEPLEVDIVGPPEEEIEEGVEIGILTGCFPADEDWSFCSGSSVREETV
ncbi:hypothetical protein GX411_01440 [Candidatus Fermentibacteria bacterium]|nr:hypothetical protein [Candidatus Fermentibacteria bacterium]